MTDSEQTRGTSGLTRLVLTLAAVLLTLLIAGMLAAAGFYLARNDYFARTYALTVRCPDALGLDAGAPVTLKGVRIGSVARPALSGREVYLPLKIRDRYKIPRGSRFLITPAMLTLPGGVQVVPPGDAGQTAGTIPPRTTGLVGEVRVDPLSSLEQAAGLLRQMEQTVAKTDRLLNETTRMAHSAGTLMADERLQRDVRQTAASLSAVSANSREMTEELSALVGQARPRSLAALSNMTAVTADARKMTAAASRLTTGSGGLLAKGQLAKSFADTLASFKASTDNMKELTGKLNALATTTQKFAGNPAVQKDVAQTLRNVQEISDTSKTLLDKLNEAPTPKP